MSSATKDTKSDDRFEQEGGTEVAGGKHVVPEGVAVEPLSDWSPAKKLKNKCPVKVKALLEAKGLVATYDDMVEAICDHKANDTLSWMDTWVDQAVQAVMDQFRDDFAEKGVKLALCRRVSGSGSYRWIEFIDTDVLTNYVPQYDTANVSSQTIKTLYATLKFPNGVVIEQIKEWNGRERLKEKIPEEVEELMTKKGLTEEYDQLVEACVNQGVGRKLKNWKLRKLQEVMDEYRPVFEAKGVAIHVSHKEEWVSHGPNGQGHMDHYRWIEFVDKEVLPGYVPQRSAENKPEEQCVIS
mmetsp:Transcript_8160/g.12918  ORF Transcript_8160/g.12918 Transcript_8160/m.12918 type:complete len:297 (+) Transcript_8160:2-892(+)